jgi:hypothetical protein
MGMSPYYHATSCKKKQKPWEASGPRLLRANKKAVSAQCTHGLEPLLGNPTRPQAHCEKANYRKRQRVLG